jgi:hypothetical protein
VNNILQAALDLHDAGCSVVPARTDGSKAPIGSWKQYQVTRPTRDEVIEWFKDGHEGIGIITGSVSGNLEMLEAEGRAVHDGLFEQAKDLAINSGLEEIWNVLVSGYVEMTPSGGLHFLYRIADEPVPGNTKVARRPGENDSVQVLFETRGQGGFVVTAPSQGATHPSGNPWVLLTGSPATIPMFSMEEREAIHTVFKTLDSMPARDSFATALLNSSQSDESKPGTDFNNKATWDEILIPVGWTKGYTAKGHTLWTRPNKSSSLGYSASSKEETGNLYVFSTSTIFEAEKPYSKFAAYAAIHHGNDFKAAARDLRAKGYGAPLPTLNSLPSLIELAKPSLSVVPSLDSDQVEQPRERSSWFPKPLDLEGTEEEPPPAFLARNDGHRLFYRGKVNALLGESESGKTWVALHAVAQCLQVQERVIYIDFEDSGKGILSRLRSLGITDKQLANFTYANPDENLQLEQRHDLVEALAQQNPDFIVVDGVNAGMTLLGLDLTNNRDATMFSQSLLKPLTMSGAAICTIDHVTKSKEGRGNYAIGAQAKRADINGVAIAVEVVQPFGRGMTGELNLKVTKDRPGHVRANSKDAKIAGRVVIKSTAEGMVTMIIESPEMSSFRPTRIMESVSMLIEVKPMSKNAIEKATDGANDTVRAALDCLVKEGFATFSHGPRNALIITSVKPFRQLETMQQSEIA